MKRVVLHIGSPKTGTSIIQSHLAQNRVALRKQGFFYPVTISSYKHLYRTFESHHLLMYSLAGWQPFTLYSPQRFLERASAACARWNMHTLLLSAENTYWLPRQIVARERPEDEVFWEEKAAYVRDIHRLFQGVDFQVVIYLRRQDRWIESWYNQQVKNGNFLGHDMSAFVEHHHPLLDYERLLNTWAGVCGKDNVIVRVYEKEQLPDGLFADFCETTGIPDAAALPLHKPARYNAQLERDALEFIHLCNSLPLDPADKLWLRLLIRRVTNQFESQLVFHKQSLIRPQLRLEVVERHAEANARIARDYLGREDGVLFREPRPDPAESWEPYPGLSAEVVTRLMVPILVRVGSEDFWSERRGQARRRQVDRVLEPFRDVARPLIEWWHERADERLWAQKMWDHG